MDLRRTRKSKNKRQARLTQWARSQLLRSQPFGGGAVAKQNLETFFFFVVALLCPRTLLADARTAALPAISGPPRLSHLRLVCFPAAFPPNPRPLLVSLCPSLPRRLSRPAPAYPRFNPHLFQNLPSVFGTLPHCFSLFRSLSPFRLRHPAPQTLFPGVFVFFVTPRGHRFTKTAQNNLRLGLGLMAILIMMMLPLAIISVVVFSFSFQRRLG